MGFAGFLRQSTAVDVKIGPFVDSTDGDAEETGLTIANTDVILSKNGQTGAAKNDATSAAHAEDGMYNCELDATDTNTVGQLTIGVHVAGALFVRHDFQVVEEAVFDKLYASGASLNDLSAAQVNAEVDTALVTTTYAEPAAVHAATASLKDKIGWLAAKARNEINQTATTQSVRNDGDSADIAAATVSDDGTTFVRGEFA